MSIRTISEEALKKKFGERVKQLRKEKGFSQEKLAFDIGMDLTSVNEIEKGHRSPKLITIYKISQALNVSLPDIMKL